jgi:transposase
MNSEALFGIALGLQAPWMIKAVEFKQNAQGGKELHLHVGFTKGSKFTDQTGALCPVHDTVQRQWQHLNFFEHQCFLHCAVPRIHTSDGKVVTVSVPWARPNSGFTLLCEAFAMALIERGMPVSRVAQLLGVYAQRIWTFFTYWVSKAHDVDKVDNLARLAVDETSSKKGHDYLTLGVDLDQAKVVYVTPGKGKDSLENIAQALQDKGVTRDQVSQLSMDLSPAFIAGAMRSFPKAAITFDRFHVIKLLNEAMDKVRKSEKLEFENKGNKYTFLKNPDNLSEKQQNALRTLCVVYPTLGEAYRLKTLFNEFWTMPDKATAETHLQHWYAAVEAAKIGPMLQFAKTVKAHWSGILRYVETKISNGVLEGINNKVQLAKRNARGFRNTNNFINMIYFLCGKLKFDYPTYFA